MKPTIDIDQAQRHLAILDPTTDWHIWLATDDTGRKRFPHPIAGRLDKLLPEFELWQRDGFAIHLTVNAMLAMRRSVADVAWIRAIYAEMDGPPIRSFPLPESLCIRTSTGKWHLYWFTEHDDPPTVAEATAMLAAIVVRYGADPNAKDVARVLRLAGTLHQKGEAQRVAIIGGNGRRYARRELLSAFPPLPTPPCLHVTAPRIEHADRYVAATIEGVLGELSRAIEGMRNGTLNRAAFRLGQLGIGQEQANAILTPAALAIGLAPREIVATVRSGVRAGAANPHGRAVA